MQNFWVAVIFTFFSMSASAFVGEIEKKPTHSLKRPVLQPANKASIQFFQALRNGNFEIMDVLLNQGADINCRNCTSNGQTPLMYAMESPASGSTISKSVRYLVEKGANPNMQDNNGSTAIMHGAGKGFSPYWSQAYQVLYLIENGAQTTIKDGTGNNILHYAYGVGYSAITSGALSPYGEDGYAEVIKQVKAVTRISIERGLDVNQQNLIGETPLHRAAAKCLNVGIEFLLSMGANPSIMTKAGDSPLSIATERATTSLHPEICNETVRILQNPKQISAARPIQQGRSDDAVSGSAPQNSNFSAYAGNYSGSYTGDDQGPFQVVISQEGNITLNGKSLRSNQAFTGSGKVNSDGSLGVTLGNVSSGATFQGSINPKTGAMYGMWKNSGQAGNFSGNKQSSQGQVDNPLQAIGGLLNGLGKILAP